MTSMRMMPRDDAPSTFRTPISFVHWVVAWLASRTGRGRRSGWRGRIEEVEEVGFRGAQLLGMDGRALFIAQQRLSAESGQPTFLRCVI
jgi:hypothetical protein